MDCIAQGRGGIHLVAVGQKPCHIFHLKLTPLKRLPKIERSGIQRDNTGHINSVATLHNHHVLSGHLSNLALSL